MYRLVAIILIIIGLGLVSIAIFTPFIPWPAGSPGSVEETPQPPIIPAEAPEPPESSQPTEPLQPKEALPQENVIIFSEKELQDMVDELVDRVNQSGKAEIESIRVRLEQDRMLVSIKGEAFDNRVETEDMEIRFEDRTMFASGKASAFGLTTTLTAEVDINSEAGKLSVEVKTFKLGALPLSMLGLSGDKISATINDLIESRELTLPFDLESIRIEDGKLIIQYEELKPFPELSRL